MANILTDFVRWSKTREQLQIQQELEQQAQKIKSSITFDDEPTWPKAQPLNDDTPDICSNCGGLHIAFCPYEVHGGE